MSLHRVHLHGGSRDSGQVDRDAVRAFALGEASLGKALGATPEAVAAMRRQATACFDTGRYGACVDILLGLGAIDDIEVSDVAMLAESFFALGDDEAGEMCGLLYEQVLDAVEDTLRDLEVEA